ncbi:MAG: ABC transporter permease subunit [Burkholderiales bacterium]|nr:ABC transporter permease subunit [Burkholderiales bacterium]
MLGFLARKLATLLPTILGVTIVAFGLIRLVPGDPVEVMMGERSLSAAQHAEALQRLGLDRPLPVQYLDYLKQLAHGDLGRSLVTREPVIDELRVLFPATVELTFFALLFAVGLGLPAGMLAAMKRGSAVDHGLMGTALVGYSMPIFWWGLLLIMVCSVDLGWTPVSGRIAVEYEVTQRTGSMIVDAWLSGEPGAWLSALRHLLLPTLVLGTVPLAVVARMTRSAMLEVLREDYLRAARARGLSPMRVLWVHALRNALMPVITVIGLQMGSLLGGAVLTETLFAWPGIGKWIVDAIARRDYPVVQAGILVAASVFIVVNLGVDLLYGVVNPRVRAGGS